MNPSLEQLAQTLLWSETDHSDSSGGEPLDANFDTCDIEAASLDELHKRFQQFVSKAEAKITEVKGSSWGSIDDFYTGTCADGYYLEHDYILTVNGHGCGFWEKDDWDPEVGEILTALARQENEIHCFIQNNQVHIEFI